MEGMGLSMFLAALGAWGFCQTASFSQTGQKLIGFISKASFCVYLTHIFFLQAFARWGLRAADGPVLLTAPRPAETRSKGPGRRAPGLAGDDRQTGNDPAACIRWRRRSYSSSTARTWWTR